MSEIPLPVEMINAAAIEAREHDTTVSTDDEGWYWTCTCDTKSLAAADYDEAAAEARHHIGTSILAAALGAGETRTEWASHHTLDDIGAPPLLQETQRDGWLARERVRSWRAGRPDRTSRLMSREVTTFFGPWIEVPDA